MSEGSWFHAAGADTAKDRRPKFVALSRDYIIIIINLFIKIHQPCCRYTGNMLPWCKRGFKALVDFCGALCAHPLHRLTENIITSIEEVMFSILMVCLSVCLTVNKIT